MTILHLIAGLQTGGAENQLQQFVTASNREQFRHIVVSIAPGGELEGELKAAGIEVYSLGLKKKVFALRALVRLMYFIRTFRPDVLHCWMYHACLLGELAVRLTQGPPMIWGLRAAHEAINDYNPVTRQIVKWCARRSAQPKATIVNSRTAALVHRKLGYDASRMRVVFNGIDARKFAHDVSWRQDARRELGFEAEHVVVGMFARFDPMKDHSCFFRSAALLHRDYPMIRFLLAGTDVSRCNRAVWNMVIENGLQDACILLGERRDIPRLTNSLDIACLSSWSESFPNVIVEAMACAVPCVVTNAGDSADIVGDTGIVVPVRDHRALAGGIAKLVELGHEKRKELGNKARMSVLSRFSIESVGRQYEEIYEASLDHPSLTRTWGRAKEDAADVL